MSEISDINSGKKPDLNKKADVPQDEQAGDQNLVLDTSGGEMPDADRKSETDPNPGLAFAKDAEKPKIAQTEKKAL